MMKNFKLLTLTVITFAITVLYGCKKFGLLKSDEQPSIAAGSNIKDETIWQFISDNNFHATDLTGVGLFGKAVQTAGLQDMFSKPGNYTIIIPSDNAIKAFIQSIGYQNVTDIPPAVWKNLILGNTITKRVHSYDLPAKQVQSYNAINNDSLFLSREPNSTDLYVMFVNHSSTVNSTSTGVRTQNLEMSNGVAHIVDTFTFYVPQKTPADAVNVANVTYSSDSIHVTKDSYVNGGTTTLQNTNYGSALTLYVDNVPTSLSYTRRAILQFKVRNPSFSGRIGSVKVGLYLTNTNGDATITIHQNQYIDWQENTINWNNAPTQGSVPLDNFNVTSSSKNKYQFGSITSLYTTALAANQSFINVGVFTLNTPLQQFASKESGQNVCPYLLITSAPNTILTNLINNPVNVDSKTGIRTLNIQDFSLSGAKNNDIFYSVKSLPSNGTLVVNNLPVSIGTIFSQELLNKGGVKYLYSGTGSSDSLVLEASDFQGGFYNNLITLNFNIL